jgi:uncharacterized protein (DUF924 family)
VNDWRRDLLTFWFGLKSEQWWIGDAELDDEIRRRFLKVWVEKRQLPVDAFVEDPLSALAAVILFDQVPRNIFRGSAEQFATDHLAVAISREAVDRGLDKALQIAERGFLYMPFQHSERLDDQNQSVQLYTALGDDYLLGYAKKHHDVIERFGRFPHRNAILGRQPRPAEISAGDVVPW